MAGHSKFANIKHKKAKIDAKRGKIFTKIGREIAVAIKEGGSDPDLNKRLADAIVKAKSNNMPNDTIAKAIKKASSDKSGAEYYENVYEGYGPNGVAIIVETLTDNKNRTAANVRSHFTKGEGNLGTSGCVSFMFDKKGQIMVEKNESIDEDDLMMLTLEAGADDMKVHEEGYEILTDQENFSAVVKVLEENNIETLTAEIKMIPQTLTSLEGEEDIKSMHKLLDLLEDDDDVQNIWHNYDE